METQTLEGVATETENAPEMVKVLVEKRDGRVVDFDPINIISAVKSAFADLDKKIGPQEERLIRDIANQVEAEIKDRYNGPGEDRGHPEPRGAWAHRGPSVRRGPHLHQLPSEQGHRAR